MLKYVFLDFSIPAYPTQMIKAVVVLWMCCTASATSADPPDLYSSCEDGQSCLSSMNMDRLKHLSPGTEFEVDKDLQKYSQKEAEQWAKWMANPGVKYYRIQKSNLCQTGWRRRVGFKKNVPLTNLQNTHLFIHAYLELLTQYYNFAKKFKGAFGCGYSKSHKVLYCTYCETLSA